MKLRIYIVQRIFLTFITIIGVSFLVFTLSNLIPSNPAYLWAGMGSPGRALSAAEMEKIVEMYHLAEPWYVQYYYYITRIMQGDFGYSPIRQRPIISDLLMYFPNTIELGVFGLIIAIGVGIPFGIISATKGVFADIFSRLTALVGISLPLFWVGLIFQLVFYYTLGWVPDPGGRVSEILLQLYPLEKITGFLILDSILTGNWPVFFNLLQHIILPAICISLYPMAVIMRITRSSMMEVLNQDYIKTARAYGLSDRIIIYKLALKNAIIPIISAIGLIIGWILTGSVVVETIFYWPGIGRYAVDAIFTFDFPALIGFTIFASIIKISGNLLADILYGVFDPRIRG
jgi:peptide/nickel transport system permease protein